MNAESRNEKLNRWVKEVADMCQPDDIHWCNGTKEEYDLMIARLTATIFFALEYHLLQ